MTVRSISLYQCLKAKEGFPKKSFKGSCKTSTFFFFFFFYGCCFVPMFSFVCLWCVFLSLLFIMIVLRKENLIFFFFFDYDVVVVLHFQVLYLLSLFIVFFLNSPKLISALVGRCRYHGLPNTHRYSWSVEALSLVRFSAHGISIDGWPMIHLHYRSSTETTSSVALDVKGDPLDLYTKDETSKTS